MTTQEQEQAAAEVVEGEAVEIVEATPAQAEGLIAAESQAVVIREEREHAAQPPANVLPVLPSRGEWEATMAVAEKIANTPFVPTSYRGQPEAVVAAILYGREIGIGPMQALQKIHMIDGKPALSAELMMAQMRRGGLVVLSSESTRERAFIHARRSDTGEEASVEWTMDEAAQIPTKERGANIMLSQKSTWKSYPADMLWARCVGRLARRLGSDLLGGLTYAAEEVADWDSDAPDAPPARSSRPLTTDGVELRADAPLGWAKINEQLKAIDPAMPWTAWVAQALHALTGFDRLAELDEPTKRDVGIRVANGVAHLAAQLEGREFPPPTRAEVQDAFAWADSVDVRLEGPDEPLDPEEAAERAVDGDEEQDDPEAVADALRAAERDEAPQGSVASADIPFGNTAPEEETT